MSRTKPTETEKVELRFHCSTCKAKPGEWCLRSYWQGPASYLHSARYNEAIKLRALPLKGER